MGAWIEIYAKDYMNGDDESHPTMGAWIEIKKEKPFYEFIAQSHPTMGAWIEIMRF